MADKFANPLYSLAMLLRLSEYSMGWLASMAIVMGKFLNVVPAAAQDSINCFAHMASFIGSPVAAENDSYLGSSGSGMVGVVSISVT